MHTPIPIPAGKGDYAWREVCPLALRLRHCLSVTQVKLVFVLFTLQAVCWQCAVCVQQQVKLGYPVQFS